MWAAGVLFALWCGAAPPAARASESPSSASLSGSGLLTLPDTAILAPGRFTAGLAPDNRDRDPLGLDFFDYAVAVWPRSSSPPPPSRRTPLTPRSLRGSESRSAHSSGAAA